MKGPTMDDERFDRVVGQMRDETAAPGQMEAARQRVWRRLQGAGPLACEELRPELDDYAHGRLTEARRLLVKDHLSRCVDCRHALAEVEGRRQHDSMTVPPAASRRRWVPWALAASVLLAVAFLARSRLDSALAPAGPRATVERVSGTLLQLPQGALEVGAELADRAAVRTAAGSRAVLRLDDGSRVEMNGRTELDLQGAWSGDTVRLHRGDVVVRAAEQGRRRLRVITRDSVATVHGTVFAVSAAAAGSLVSVVEGEVAVTQPGFERLLEAGQQAATNPTLASVSLEEAVSWSQDADDYRALLAELGDIEERIAALTGSAIRHEPRLLPYLPDGVLAYIAIPNVDGAIAEALQLIEDRARPGSVLDEWWSSENVRPLSEAMASLEGVASWLGDEIVVVLGTDSLGDEPVPLLMAEVRAGGHDPLRRALDALAADAGEPVPYRLDGDLLLISGTAEDLGRFASEIGLGAGSPFATAIAERYEEGVAWLGAIDLVAFQDRVTGSAEGARVARALGLDNARHLIVEQKSADLGDQSRATVSFAGRRQGVASWLASPGPLGSAEYLTPDVILAASGATSEPREALEQLLEQLGPDHELAQAIEEIERQTGIRVVDDVAAALGTDFTFAIERATVPVPGWVAVMEVMDPPALDDAMRRLVDAVNAHATEEGDDHRLELSRETVNGHTWHSLSSSGDGDFQGLEWTYHLGYLVAAADRPLALSAIGTRETGTSLVNSTVFERSFPAGAGLHSSGFVWMNPEGLAQLAALAEGPDTGGLSQEVDTDPVLVLVSGGPDRLLSVSRTRLSGLLLDLLVGRPASMAD